MVIVSLNNYGNHKTEVSIRTALIGLTMILIGRLWTLILRVRKAMECVKHCLKGNTSRSMKGRSAKSYSNCQGSLKGFQRRRILCCREILIVIFLWRKWLPLPFLTNLPEIKMKGFDFIVFAEEIPKESSIDSVIWLLAFMLIMIYNEKEQAKQVKIQSVETEENRDNKIWSKTQSFVQEDK